MTDHGAVWGMIAGAAAVVALSAPLAASDPVDVPPRVVSLLVFGNDPCPRGTNDDEIVVCARQPESERYRLPKRFRGRTPNAAQESWANTARSLEYVGRETLPNSCTPIGSNGATGCFQKFQEQAREERRQARAEAAIP